MKMSLIVFVIVMSVCLSAQIKTDPGCPTGDHKLLTYWYAQFVFQHIAPPDDQETIITISLSNGSNSRLILRTQWAEYHGRKRFELLSGTADPDFDQQLDRLDAKCQLPLNPLEAVSLIAVTWKRKEISSATFEKLHRDFTNALADDVTRSQKRYASVLAHGGIVHLHTPEYLLTYDNSGYEHFETRVDDSESSPAALDPLIKWSHALENTAKKTFGKDKTISTGANPPFRR